MNPMLKLKTRTARLADAESVMHVSDSSSSEDESLGHIEGDVTPAIALQEASPNG